MSWWPLSALLTVATDTPHSFAISRIEADYALKYVDSDYTLDVRGDIGLTDADLSGQYPYTQDIATAGGKLKGVTWQATPGLFAYRRSIAKDVLGTDDPAQVQEAWVSWW